MTPQSGPTWSSPLGRRLRGLIYDSPTVLPPLGRVIDTIRGELVGAPVLGVLVVRLENWGLVSHILPWEELIKIQDGLSQAALDLKGRRLRQLDLPVDPGLAGEGFTVFLSAPRTESALDLASVDAVGRRVEAALLDYFSSTLPSELFDRISLEVGAGLIRRPEGEETFEEVLAMGLVEAEKAARAKYLEALLGLGARVEAALDSACVDVVYQPLVDVAALSVVGYDALPLGPLSPNLRPGDVFFDVAARCGLSHRAYDLYHEKALEGVSGQVRSREFLMMRVAAGELLESAVRVVSLLYRAEEERLTPGNVLFLVDSGQTIVHFAAARVAFRSVADMGFKLGIDVRSDYPLALDHWSELEPDLFRVSGRHVTGVRHDSDRLELMMMLGRFAHRHDARLLAADCADEEELTALRLAGADLVQGEYLAPYSNRPVPPGMSG
jgi:EAL domain-containing protein (putative c-di-GMP-specific phosphodiesterase class I)